MNKYVHPSAVSSHVAHRTNGAQMLRDLALYYLVVNRRSPSPVLHHLLVSGCIAPRPPATCDPSLTTIPSTCSIPSSSSHSPCRLLPRLDLSVSSGASLRHQRLEIARLGNAAQLSGLRSQ